MDSVVIVILINVNGLHCYCNFTINVKGLWSNCFFFKYYCHSGCCNELISSNHNLSTGRRITVLRAIVAKQTNSFCGRYAHPRKFVHWSVYTCVLVIQSLAYAYLRIVIYLFLVRKGNTVKAMLSICVVT